MKPLEKAFDRICDWLPWVARREMLEERKVSDRLSEVVQKQHTYICQAVQILHGNDYLTERQRRNQDRLHTTASSIRQELLQRRKRMLEVKLDFFDPEDDGGYGSNPEEMISNSPPKATTEDPAP